MSIKENLSKDSLHHAYVLEGNRTLLMEELLGFTKELLGISVAKSPDALMFEKESFGIDEVRMLQNFASRKPVAGERKVAIISFLSATVEAQNALLKTVEEPLGQTIIFMIVESQSSLLPTIKSRVQLISSTTSSDATLAKSFLKKSSSERISALEDIIKEKKKEQAINLLNDIEEILAQKVLRSEDKKSLAGAIEEVFRARGYLRGRSPSLKMILEHLSLSLPVLK